MNRHDDTTPDRLRRMAASDEMSVSRGRSEQLAQRALARAAARPRRRALAVVIIGSAMAVFGVSLGAIADQAAPGEPLYAVDRAYESVSRIVTGPIDRSEETMVEALKLIDSGKRDIAVKHLATQLTVQNGVAFESVEPDPSVEPPKDGSAIATGETVTTVPSTPTTTSAPTIDNSTSSVSSSEPEEPAVVEESEDPLKLALEYAVQTIQAAKGSEDDAVTAEAQSAVRSVLQLAIAPSDTEPAVVEEDPGAVAAAPTSTTTTTEAGTDRRGAGASGDDTTTTTTTTTVPEEDLRQTGSGSDESSTGDDLGDSQEGAGGSSEPGDGDSDTGPLILPIP